MSSKSTTIKVPSSVATFLCATALLYGCGDDPADVVANGGVVPSGGAGGEAGSGGSGGGECTEPGCSTESCTTGSARYETPLAIYAPAPVGLTDSHLGRPVDRAFLPIAGEEGATLFPEAEIVESPLNQIEHRFVFSDDTRSLAAQVSGWSVGSVEAALENNERYAGYEATQIRHVRMVDDGTAMRSAPAGSLYFISKIFYGHNYSAVIRGTRSSFHSGVRSELTTIEGNIEGFVESRGLEATFLGRGLSPKTGSAIFARSAGDIESSYATDGPPVPIFVEYQSLPGACIADSQSIEWDSAIKTVMSFDGLYVLENGSLMDDIWSLNVACSVNRNEIDIPKSSIWDHREDICDSGDGVTDDGISFCAFGLDFKHVFQVIVGDRIACTLTGTAHDNDLPLRTTEVEFVIPEERDPVEGVIRAGNPDTAQFELIYSISYE